jgi:hypothetical protein
MRLVSRLIPATLATGLALLALPLQLTAQQSIPTSAPAVVPMAIDMPDAPQPQFAVASLEPMEQQTAPAASGSSSSQDRAQTPGAQTPGAQTTGDQQPAKEKTQEQKAEDQIKEQEQQRLVGIVPMFNISYRADAVSMTAKQKIGLAFHSVTDPVAFGVAALAGGYHEINDGGTGFEWGAKGYGERAGAAYLDAFTGNMLGNGVLPALLHQDPRYFRLGHGTITHRTLYALMTNVMCKHDNTNRWEPNISNIGGNIAGGAISNLYYPSTNSGISETFSNGFLVTAEGGFGSLFDEFWPDISRKFLHKDPTDGRDAQARAADAAAKQAKKDAKVAAK